MPKILIVAEQAEGQLKRATLSSVTFAREEIAKGGGSFAFLVIGQSARGAADALAGYGAEKVYLAEAPQLASYTAEAYTPAVDKAAKAFGADTVVGTAT